jgi:hypothetical protein
MSTCKHLRLDVEETLRLCGVESNELKSWSQLIKNGKGYEEANRNYQKVAQLLCDSYSQMELLRTYPFEKLRELNTVMSKLLKPAVMTTQKALQAILDGQDIQHKPKRKFTLITHKELMYKTWGLKTGFYIVSADPSVGKTGFNIQLAMDVLFNNPESRVIYLSLDDIKLKIMERMISSACYVSLGEKRNDFIDTIPEINCSGTSWSYWDENLCEFVRCSKTEERKKIATQMVKAFVDSKRLIVEDGEHGFDSIEKIIYENGDNENTLLIIDAVYNVSVPNVRDLEKDDLISKFLKMLVVKHNLTLLAIKDVAKKSTVKGAEIDDVGNRKKIATSISDTKGSASWEYNCDAMATMYEKDGKFVFNLQKNKIGGRKFIRYYEQIFMKNVYQELQTVIKKNN